MTRYVLHCFRPGETIDAVIKMHGVYSLSPPQLQELREKFNEMNGGVLPRPGASFKIPLPKDVDDDDNGYGF